ncbi:MAG: tryptophan--tRNA ligase, partial [bacterium]
DENKKGTVFLFESPEEIRKKIKSAVTDSGSGIYCDAGKPGITNLVEILAAVTDQSIEAVENQYRSYDYGTFKDVVAEAVIEHLKPMQTKYAELMADQAYLQSVLDKGREVAQKRADRMMSKVYRKAGMI